MSKVAKSGLKFVKKRVAGHKRSAEEIEEEAYERELAIQAAREAGLASSIHPSHQVRTVLPPKAEKDEGDSAQSASNPLEPVTSVKKSSEDWELFNKLLGKVETAVASTVQSIEKVKESSVVEEIIAKEQKEAVVIPEYKGVKSLEEAKREKEEREREALRQRRDADEWERALNTFDKKQTPDFLCLDASSASATDDGGEPKLSFAYYSPSSGPSAIPKTPLEVDPFDTSFISPVVQDSGSTVKLDEEDPFDTQKIDKGIEEVAQLTQKRMSLSGGVNPFGGSSSGSGVQEDPNPRVRPPSRPTAGSSLFSSTECSPVDIPDDVQNFFKNASRRSSTNPFDPPTLAAPQQLSTEDTIRTGAALLQAIASEFADKDDDDDLYHRTLSSKGGLPPPSPISPFSESDAAVVDQAVVPELMDMLAPTEAKASNIVSSSSTTTLNPTNTLATVSSAFNPTAASIDPFTDQMVVVGNLSEGVPVTPLAPSVAPTLPPPSSDSAVPVDAFQLAFGKKSIDLDDVPPQAQADLPPHELPQMLQSIKDSFDPFKDVQQGLELPTTNVPGPVSGAPTPGSDVFESELRQQEEELFGSNDGSKKAPEPPTLLNNQPAPQFPLLPLSNLTNMDRTQLQRPTPPPAAAIQERKQSSTRSSITKEDSLVDIKCGSVTSNGANNGRKASNPFSPENSQHGSLCFPENPCMSETEQKDVSLPNDSLGNTAAAKPSSPENPFGSSTAKEKSSSSPENPFSPGSTATMTNTGRGETNKIASPPKSENVFSRKTSQDSNPFSPTATLPPVNVGINNPFGKNDEAEATDVSFSSAFAASAPAASATVVENTPFTFTNESADPFDTENIVPATDQSTLGAFASKFNSTADGGVAELDPFEGLGGRNPVDISGGFGGESFQNDSTDYLSEGLIPTTQVPDNTPVKKANLAEPKDSFDSDEEEEHMRVTIKPKLRPIADLGGAGVPLPKLATPIKLLPPPKSPSRQAGYQVQPDRFNPFDKGSMKAAKTADEELFNAFEDALLSEGQDGKDGKEDVGPPPALGDSAAKQTGPLSPSTPLYDEDISQPLSEWKPKVDVSQGWDFYLRWPNKKKFTGNRYWKPVHVKFADTTILWVMNKRDDSDPIQEVPLQGCYSLSEMAHQQFDQFKKIFTIKLQYTFYKETVGVRKGQIAKVMSGQVNSMGSVAKLGLPLQHVPQLTQLLKLGTSDIDSIRTFVQVIEDVLFRLQIHRDRALTYKCEEIQAMVVDEYVVDIDKVGHVCSQKARVRIFFLAFVNGMPDVEVGINELTRQGKEIVGRHDIMPIVTEEWIRVEDCEFHACVERQEFIENKVIKVRPPDATFFELMRFRVRPPRQRELPIQLTAVLRVSPPKVQLKAEVLVPGYSSRKHGQIPCEDIAMFFPIPECWVYLFRVEKHFRYGALKSSNRRHGKIKGLERIMGAAAGGNIEKQLIEVTAGQAKYEPAYKCIVWRVPRLPKEGQGAYTQQMMTVDLELTSFDQIPTEFNDQLRVEFTMPASTVSHTTIRSITCPTDAELPVEKYCRYVAKHEYTVEMDVQVGTVPLESTPLGGITRVEAREPQVPPTPPPPVRQVGNAASDSDDSD
ncbi:protein stoned-B-like isoform X5 [Varroa destructor]|nr:protein stoned-B-like isoform X5 [Varroa destructor]